MEYGVYPRERFSLQRGGTSHGVEGDRDVARREAWGEKRKRAHLRSLTSNVTTPRASRMTRSSAESGLSTRLPGISVMGIAFVRKSCARPPAPVRVHSPEISLQSVQRGTIQSADSCFLFVVT